MCEYAVIRDGQLPLCEPLNKLCTLCFMGNMNQYNECQRVLTERQYTPKKENKA